MLNVLGPPKLQAHNFSRPVPIFLLAYLACEGGKHDRRRLAALFWPEHPPDDSSLPPLAEDIINQIEARYGSCASQVVTIPLHRSSDKNIYELEEAHSALKLQGFINGVSVDDELTSAVYKLTSRYSHQLAGTPSAKLSRTNLRNALHKLKSLGKGVLVSDGPYVWTEIETDLAALKKAITGDDLDAALNSYKPFLENIEAQLTSSQYEMGTELALWLADSRRTIVRQLQEACVEDAWRQLDAGQTEKVERRVFAALDANDDEGMPAELTGQVLDVLKHCTSPRLAQAQKRLQAFGSYDPLVIGRNRGADLSNVRANSAVIDSSPTLDVVSINLRTWQISSQHLASLMDVKARDERGTLVSQVDSKPRSYVEELFVSSEEGEVIDRFLASDKRGLFLVGPSGSGKSNLLCHSFLNERRRGNLTVFLNARLLHGPDFPVFLRSQVLGSIQQVEQAGFEALDISLAKAKKPLIIYLDAINEHNVDRGPLALLESVVSFVRDTRLFSSVKVVASCRTETWKNYKEVLGDNEPLRGTVFESNAGDAVTVSGFDSERNRKRLFDAYQHYYELSPKRYEAQSESLRQLIKTPFMMSVIAESYSNRKWAGGRLRIPKQLDYLTIFRDMTQRKLRDARHLLNPGDPKRDLFESTLRRCLFTFAERVYEKLVSSSAVMDAQRSPISGEDVSGTANRTDTLSVDELAVADLSTFMEPFSPQSAISPFAALVQLNLLEETTVSTSDFWGTQSEVKAYRFYHDQYTQYWLAAVLSKNVLGRVSTETLAASRDHLESTSEKIACLLDEAKVAPLLAGAVESWLYTNMVEKRKLRDYLVVLFDELAAKPSGLVSYYVGMFLHNLIDKDIISAKELYQNLFIECRLPLKQALAYTYLELWPQIKPDDFRALLDALDAEADGKMVHALADIFVELYRLDSAKVLRLLDKALDSSDRALNFLTASLIKRHSVVKQLTFVAQFALKSFHYSSSGDYDALPLKDFLLKRYNYPLQALISDKSFGLQAQLKPLLYKKLEESGVNSWEQASRAQGNDLFFTSDNGTVQRDVLHEYYKYAVALHNGEYKTLSLRDNREFREMTLRMLTFRPGSVIGYMATMVAAFLASNDETYFDLLLRELLEHDSEASRFSLGVIATQAVYFNPCLASFILDRLRRRFVRHQLDYGYESEEVFSSFISVAATDLGRLGRECLDTLDEVMRAISSSNDSERAAAFGDRLANSNFHPDPKVGLLVVKHLLARGDLRNPFWKPATLRVLAGMLARNPKVLHELLEVEDETGSVLDEIRQHLDNDLLLRKDQVSYQMSWNWFFVSGWTSRQLSYYIIRDLLGGLVQSNSVEDFAKGYRRFFVEMAKGFLTDQKPDYTRLSVAEAMSLAESSRDAVGPSIRGPG